MDKLTQEQELLAQEILRKDIEAKRKAQEDSWEGLNSEMSDALHEALEEISRLEQELKQARDKLYFYTNLKKDEAQEKRSENIKALLEMHKKANY